MLKKLDKIWKGRKIYLNSSVFVLINGYLISVYALDLVPVVENIELVVGSVNTLLGILNGILRKAQNDGEES